MLSDEKSPYDLPDIMSVCYGGNTTAAVIAIPIIVCGYSFFSICANALKMLAVRASCRKRTVCKKHIGYSVLTYKINDIQLEVTDIHDINFLKRTCEEWDQCISVALFKHDELSAVFDILVCHTDYLAISAHECAVQTAFHISEIDKEVAFLLTVIAYIIIIGIK